MPIKYNDNFVITYTKKITQNAKEHCKIFKFLSEWDCKKISDEIFDLNIKMFPNLLIFIIEIGIVEDFKNICIFLLKFSENRPLLLQLTSKNQNVSQFYFKREDAKEFLEIYQLTYEEDNFHDFSTFFTLLKNRELDESFENLIIEKLTSATDSSIIIRFLRALKLSEGFLRRLFFTCTAKGTKNDFLSILDISFNDMMNLSTSKIQKSIIKIFKLMSCNDDSIHLVLKIAVENSNKDVVDFLITNCKPMIHQFNYFEYQSAIEISTAASNQTEILCSLLDGDFPFPRDFDPNSVTDEQLRKIINDRNDFHNSIATGNRDNLEIFIKNNPNLKFVYNPTNDSALFTSVGLRKFDILHFLRSYGFRAKEYDTLRDVIGKDDVPYSKASANIQRRENIRNAQSNSNSSIILILARSFIHNKILSKETENVYWGKIESWLIDIYKTKIGCKLIDACSQCTDVKLIYDFECEEVDNIHLIAENASGITNTTAKWIFIGAQLHNSKCESREQRIKGVIAHEMCHYVLRLVYENKENPYYEGDDEKAKMFEDIVDTYKKIFQGNSENKKIKIDDECGGQLALVFSGYEPKDHHPELVVIAPQIQAEFGNKKQKVAKLEVKYKLLFDYVEKFVLPEIEKFNLKQRENVRKLNVNCEVFREIDKLSSYEFSKSKDLNDLINNQYSIVTTNTPKLFLLNIYKHLQKEKHFLLNTKYVFASQKILRKFHILSEIKRVILEIQNLHVFLDCSEEFESNLKELIIINTTKFLFIVSNENQYEKITQLFEQTCSIELQTSSIDYTWTDLKKETQKLLLQTKVNFQGCSQFSILDLISNENDTQKNEGLAIEQTEELIDDQVLNLLLEKSEIMVNNEFENEIATKYFKILYQPRKFKKVQTNLETVIGEDQLVKNVQNETFVLISDNAGTGKSWVMKKIANMLQNNYPKKWIIFVDLKQVIEVLQNIQNIQKFSSFIVDNILKVRINFEAKLFSRLYENGKICIIFDGFDEIAPDCTEAVLQLFSMFIKNDGNQLWIATRDYFEKDLKEKLYINDIYKLEEFTKNESINMLATSWVLHDVAKEISLLSEKELKQRIENSANFLKYQKFAKKVSKEILGADSKSIGIPQLFKMIADVFKDKKNKVFEITVPRVYLEFIQMQNKRWSKEKGKLREKASTKQNYILSFREIHQLFGMKSLFPDSSNFCHLQMKDCDWKIEEIIACGLLNKKGESFYFPHETFREYYAADFILEALRKSTEPYEDFCKFLITFLTVNKFGIIRMFLNEFFAQNNVCGNFSQKFSKISEWFFEKKDQLVNLTKIFEENLEALGLFLINILKHGKYEDVKIILDKNKGMIKFIVKQPIYFQALQDYMLSLETHDFKNCIIHYRIFHKVAGSTLDDDVFEEFILEVEGKTDSRFIAETLRAKDEYGENIISCSVQSNHADSNKFKWLIQILKRFLYNIEIIQFMEECNIKGYTIFHEIINLDDQKKLELLWKELEKIYGTQNTSQKFKDLISKKSHEQQSTILHFSANCKNIEVHKTLWKLLLNTFKNFEDLRNLIFLSDKNGDNFLHVLIEKAKSDKIEYVFRILQQNIMDSFQEILKSKGIHKQSLLQRAACCSKELKTHQFLWKTFLNSCESVEKFMEILRTVDEYGYNVFGNTASNSTREILEFMAKKLETIAQRDEIRNLLCNVTVYKRNLLLLAGRLNKSLELHESLWRIIRKYFDASEILEFIKYLDIYDHNFLLNAIEKNLKGIIEFSWKQITEVLNNCDFVFDIKTLHLCDNAVRFFLKFGEIKEDEQEILKLKWVQNVNSDSSSLFHSKIRQINENELSGDNLKYILSFASDTNIENQKILWKNLLKTCNDREEIKNIILKKDNDGDNFLHNLVIANKANVIEFTFKIMNENFNDAQYQEILKSNGNYERDLLQNALRHSKDLEVHAFLWKYFQEFHKSSKDFIDFLNKTDNINRNVFNVAAGFSTCNILEFINEQLEKITSRDEIRKLLRNLNIHKKNLLQSAAEENKSLRFHKSLWKIIYKYFDSYEILEFIKNFCAHEKNFLLYAVKENTKEVLEFSWRQITEVLNSNDDFEKENIHFEQCDKIIKNVLEFYSITQNDEEILKLKWIKNKNIVTIKSLEEDYGMLDEKKLSIKTLIDLKPFTTNYRIEHHKILWNNVISNFKDCTELKKLLSEKDSDSDNYIHNLVSFNKADVIEFTIIFIRQNLTDSQFQEVIKSKGWKSINLLHRAARNSNCTKTYQFLLKTLQNSCKSVDEFFEFLEEINDFNRNVVSDTIIFATSEALEFMDEELEKIASRDQIKELWLNIDFNEQNILQVAAEDSKFLDMHEILWNIISKYFNSLEILEFINHRNKDYLHLLHVAVFYNTKEIIEFIWEKIKLIIIKREYQIVYLNEKGRKEQNLYQLSLERTKKDPQVTLWVKNIMKEYKLNFLE